MKVWFFLNFGRDDQFLAQIVHYIQMQCFLKSSCPGIMEDSENSVNSRDASVDSLEWVLLSFFSSLRVEMSEGTAGNGIVQLVDGDKSIRLNSSLVAFS